MRAPAQHRLGPTARTAWAHPYTGISGLAVFYNDGGDPQQAAVPSPAEIAARAAQQPVAKPNTPEPLVDQETGLAMTQARFSKIMAREHSKGRFNAFRELAEAAGVPFDGVLSSAETFDPAAFVQVFKDAEKARKEALSEDQRKAEDLAAREKAINERLAAAEAREKAAADRDRDSRVQAALVKLGATGDDLTDATLLLKARLADDADDQALEAAAAALKEQRAALFGTAPAAVPQTLPPAPSGSPASGGMPRTPAPGKDAIKTAARDRARTMGLRRDDAA
ncbi:hypothetical protein [Streptomyces zhihengii]